MVQPPQTQQSWIRAEESARHGVFVFLILLTLANLDIMARATRKEQENATREWVAWGVVFVLLAFFIIVPEQEQIQARAGTPGR
ncbi:hypothetical protein C7445_102128 [Alicyclobacillus sacchari]|uniref:Phospholipase D-like protein n=1 Tax=Alicyclobacillus sacchari TaxID=392010 RepID=A0A4R8LSD9_9BACL|nr:hypothetical protein [Alicyclobacillus sacchari]TDY50569.1 hypothetical protein C7445_102128 [Alicyclobacillus sacchari]GMA55529.1 hypothetical protein GCM10025858_00320 [Alicyclobacillus sacchari]GMA59125.1 hypothetical protein GCM10025858_36280 [Alicyclobacillus sacchari]